MDSEELTLELVSHASVVIQTPVGGLWTDPWLRSRAFNDSWALLGQVAAPNDADLESIRWLWVSHEHPDHFNVPTLRSLPVWFKEQVTVLFQENNSDKVEQAFQQFGFPRFQSLPHRKQVSLEPGLDVYCYQVGQMDSALWLGYGGRTILNVNDAELSDRDCKQIVADLGPVDTVLNQFSIAGYDGLPDPAERLAGQAARVIDNMVANHRGLGVRTTVPIASFVYFCTPDNAYVNAFANTPTTVADRFNTEGLTCKVLKPGDPWAIGGPTDNGDPLAYWRKVYDDVPGLEVFEPEILSANAIEDAFYQRAALLLDRYPRSLLRSVSPITISVPDLAVTFRLSFFDNSIVVADDPHPDVEMNSQPLHFLLSNTFGLQTLGVSARYRLLSPNRRWKLLRVLMALENAEIYLRPKYLRDPRLARFLAVRAKGAGKQLAYQVRRM